MNLFTYLFFLFLPVNVYAGFDAKSIKYTEIIEFRVLGKTYDYYRPPEFVALSNGFKNFDNTWLCAVYEPKDERFGPSYHQCGKEKEIREFFDDSHNITEEISKYLTSYKDISVEVHDGVPKICAIQNNDYTATCRSSESWIDLITVAKNDPYNGNEKAKDLEFLFGLYINIYKCHSDGSSGNYSLVTTQQLREAKDLLGTVTSYFNDNHPEIDVNDLWDRTNQNYAELINMVTLDSRQRDECQSHYSMFVYGANQYRTPKGVEKPF